MTYPHDPGFQNTDTSKNAASSMKDKAETLRIQSYKAIKTSRSGLTADEVAFSIRKSILAIRPRITELKMQGAIIDSGIRRENSTGRNAAVFIINAGQ